MDHDDLESMAMMTLRFEVGSDDDNPYFEYRSWDELCLDLASHEVYCRQLMADKDNISELRRELPSYLAHRLDAIDKDWSAIRWRLARIVLLERLSDLDGFVAAALGAMSGDKGQIARIVELLSGVDDEECSYWAGVLCPLILENPLYIVVDLSGGPIADSYPVVRLAEEPVGGFNTDEYKTSKLVLRRIPAGTFMMGSPENEVGRRVDEDLHEVTLTKPFYIGVFEVTQKQWQLVMGSNPSIYSGEKRPVEDVSWNMIRGYSNLPNTVDVDKESFMGRLRARAILDDGLLWDLPTEAQWEYACRAGTNTALNSGKNLKDCDFDKNLAEVGRFRGNRDHSHHATVGSYLPNVWGLYDMHGNVWEWCRDKYSSSLGTTSVTDPMGPCRHGGNRVRRGGAWGYEAYGCRSAFRHWAEVNCRYDSIGFRLSLVTDQGQGGLPFGIQTDEASMVSGETENKWIPLISRWRGTSTTGRASENRDPDFDDWSPETQPEYDMFDYQNRL